MIHGLPFNHLRTFLNMKTFHKPSFLIGCFLLFVQSNEIYPQSLEDIYDSVTSSIVAIISYDATGSDIAFGSGVFITDNGMILTNQHVIDGAFSAEVKTIYNNYEMVQILSESSEYDLAILQIDVSNSTPIIFPEGEYYLRPGQPVIAIGNPLGFEKTISEGIISGVRQVSKNLEYIQTTAPISPGSSGGVLLDENGYLIGLTTSTIQEGQNINFAISLNTIYAYFDFCMSRDPNASMRNLEMAGTKIWYRVVFKWIKNVFIIIFAALFSGAFYWVLPLIFIGLYLVYFVLRGIWFIVTLPFKKFLRSNQIGYQNIDSPSDYSYKQTEYFGEDISESDDDDEESRNRTGAPVNSIYCPWCGNENHFVDIVSGEIVSCEYCKREFKHP